MTIAVYYSSHNMPVEDLPTKHTLPSLSQIMPPVQQLQSVSLSILNGGQGYNHDGSNNHSNNSPSSTSTSPSLKYNTQQPQPMHQVPSIGGPASAPMPSHHSQSLPDLYSQSSTAQTTPGSSYAPYGQPVQQMQPPQAQQPVIGGIANAGDGSSANGRQDKCICKSNANRIPRPRNAFILFRQKYHQTVLDEGSVIRTNPEVSRELGRRWRALSPEEKEHWNNLAEEEKKNHAKKYPGYRYTPRRNGKNKNCVVCREKALKQQQQQQQQVKQAQLVQMQSQQMMQIQQDQYYLQLQQQQQFQQLQQTQQQLQQQMPLNGYQQQQYIISPSPYQQNLLNGPVNGGTTLPLPQQQQPNQAQQLQFYDADKLSPLSGQQTQPPSQQQANAQPQAQHHQQLGSGPSYASNIPQTASSILQHPAGSGNEYTISGYDAQRYSSVGGNGSNGATTQGHHPQQQQHSNGANNQPGSTFAFDTFSIQQPSQ